MNIYELVNRFYHKLNGPDDATAEDAMRVVVTAIRDEAVPPEFSILSDAEKAWLKFFDEILGDAESEKAAGPDTAKPEAIERSTPAAPKMCEWTEGRRGGVIPSCSDLYEYHPAVRRDGICPECYAPIKFKETT